jgi:hypothetical protein
MRGREPGPEVVSAVVQRALEAPKPKARYLAGVAFPASLILPLRDLLWNAALQRMFGVTLED